MKNRRARKLPAADKSSAVSVGVDGWIDKLKRHPFTGAAIFLCLLLIALGNTLDAGTKLSGFLSTLRQSAQTPIVATHPPRTSKPQYVAFDASEPFSGYWSMQFYFISDTANRADRSRPWFNWGTDLRQNGDTVTGDLRTAEHSGRLEGMVDGRILDGRVQFSWGNDWWRSFRLTIDEDAKQRVVLQCGRPRMALTSMK